MTTITEEIQEKKCQRNSFSEKLSYKTTKETEKLIFEWTKTGKLNFREHTLLYKYVYQVF